MTTTPSSTTSFVAVGDRRLDDPDAFEAVTTTLGRLAPTDILVRVHAVSVNPVDHKVRTSLHGESRQLGWDASGVVEAVGDDVDRFKAGDEVWYAGAIDRPGSNAELHVVDSRIVSHKPHKLAHTEAAALPLTSITAWETLFDRFGMTESSTGTLLVVGAPGGVGSILIQLAKQLPGVTVIATAGRPESREWVFSLGADHVVDRRNLATEVRATAPAGVDWIFTAHSSENIAAFAEIIKPFGQITAIDDPAELDLLPLKGKSVSWHWELMFTRSLFEADPRRQGALLKRIADMVDEGTIRSTLTTVIPNLNAESIRRAHRLIASGETIGKVVIG
jgi:NADPH2:quinone reductase